MRVSWISGDVMTHLSEISELSVIFLSSFAVNDMSLLWGIKITKMNMIDHGPPSPIIDTMDSLKPTLIVNTANCIAIVLLSGS